MEMGKGEDVNEGRMLRQVMGRGKKGIRKLDEGLTLEVSEGVGKGMTEKGMN